jgi:hypothetical protein
MYYPLHGDMNWGTICRINAAVQDVSETLTQQNPLIELIWKGKYQVFRLPDKWVESLSGLLHD